MRHLIASYATFSSPYCSQLTSPVYHFKGLLVSAAGLEPARAKAQQILSLWCIPIPPRRDIKGVLSQAPPWIVYYHFVIPILLWQSITTVLKLYEGTTLYLTIANFFSSHLFHFFYDIVSRVMTPLQVLL